MATPRTYHASVLVLRKRKLGEADLILSMLSGDGSLVEAVAKGARKPTSSFATRLDLFCESEVMLTRGRNLDIASEVRLLNSHDAVRTNVAATYAAAPILDLLAQVALPNLPVEHLFAMATSALDHMDALPEERMPSITAAFLIKLFALLGVRPQLTHCIVCGEERPQEASGEVFFSFADGGYICNSCQPTSERVRTDNATLTWAQVLLGATFDEVAAMDVAPEASFAVLQFANQYLRESQHINSKALNQLLSCGLF